MCLTLQSQNTLPDSEARRYAIDQNEIYQLSDGTIRRLHRLAGTFFVQLDDVLLKEQTLRELTQPNGILEGFTTQEAGYSHRVYLNAPRAVRDEQLARPELIEQAVQQLRQVDNLSLANPVYIDPETGLRSVILEGFLLQLRGEVDSVDYFANNLLNVRFHGQPNIFEVDRKGRTATEILDEVNQHAQDPRVVWAEPIFLMDARAHWSEPDDPLWGDQWGLNNLTAAGPGITVRNAWDRTRGAGTTIAILDVGTQLDHPDLADQMLERDDPETPGDDDQNGYPDDSYGWDFHTVQSPPPPPTEPDGDNDPGPSTMYDNHGTMCAGIATASTFNGQGVAGTAPDASLLIVRVAQADPTPQNPNNWDMDSAKLAEGIRYAAGEKYPPETGTLALADVISMSFMTTQSSCVDAALDFAATSGRGGKGSVLLASSGNRGSGWKWKWYGLGVSAPSGNYTFKWTYSKNSTVTAGSDTVWLDQVYIRDVGTEDFEESAWPGDWIRTGDANWSLVENGVAGNHAITGALGEAGTVKAIRSGSITHSESTSVEVTHNLPSNGGVGFNYWISSEASNDVLTLEIQGPPGYGTQTFTVGSGEPSIAPTIGYPASHSKVIAVGGSSKHSFRVDYSQFDANPSAKTVDFLAPTRLDGVYPAIATTDRTGGDGYTSGDYLYGGGTSASCPMAAGVAALLLSYKPNLTAEEVRTHLRDNCLKIGGIPYDSSGRNAQYGSGLINAHRAIAQGAVDLGFTGPGTGANGSIKAVAYQTVISSHANYAIVGGSFSTFDGTSRSYLARVWRGSWALDTAFAPSIASHVLAIGVQDDEKILVGTVGAPYLLRLNADGTTDTAFSPTLNGAVHAIAMEADGNILIGGTFTTVNGVGKPKLARLFTNGSLDNYNYWYSLDINGPVYSIVLQPDGKMLIGGGFTSIYTSPNWETRYYLARMHATGGLDTTFENPYLNGAVYALGLLDDGSIVAGGDFGYNSPYSPTHIVRYSSTGQLLWSPTSIPGINGPVYSILVDNEQDILVGGLFSEANGATANNLARLRVDGTTDPYFDVESGPNSTVEALAFDTSLYSRPVAMGSFTTVNGIAQGRITRLHGINE